MKDGKEFLGKAQVRKPACDVLFGEWCSRGMEPLQFFIYYLLFSIWLAAVLSLHFQK